MKEVRQLNVGKPLEEGVFLGPVTRQEQLDFLQQQVDDALQKGAKLLAGGKKMDRKGDYFEPTILVNVTHKMSVMKDETFGTVIGIQRVKQDEEPVEL